MSNQLPPLETRPIGPRRALQKIFADKDLRDAWIASLEKEVGNAPDWFSDFRIDVNRAGRIKVTYLGGAGPRSSRRSNAA